LETAVGRGTMDRRNGAGSFPSIYLSINQWVLPTSVQRENGTTVHSRCS